MTTVVAPRGALSIAGAVLAGAISAVIFGFGLKHAGSILFFAIYVAPISVFMAGLGTGILGGVIAVLVAFAGLLINEPSNYAVLYAIIYGVPSVALSVLALRHVDGSDGKTLWYPEGHLMTALVLYPSALFIVCALAASGHPGGLLGLTSEFINAAIEPVKNQMAPGIWTGFSAMLDKIIVFLPAVLGVSWTFIEIIGIAIAQSSLQKNGWNLRNNFSLQDFRVPRWMFSAFFVASVVGAATPPPWNYAGANLSLMLALPFFFDGLAVVHAWAALRKATVAILVVFYIILSVLPMLALLVALLGIIDQWANFRQRFSQKTKTT